MRNPIGTDAMLAAAARAAGQQETKMKRKLLTVDEAPTGRVQHYRPCSDCPMDRAALPGWLGGASPEEYRQLAHSDEVVDCHAIRRTQCAGMAIYRANVAKRRPDGQIACPADHRAVFSTPAEFLAHHTRRPK